MSDIFTIVTNFGLGIGSFIALIFFYNKFMDLLNNTLKEQTETLSKINESQLQIQITLENLSDRIDKLENGR